MNSLLKILKLFSDFYFKLIEGKEPMKKTYRIKQEFLTPNEYSRPLKKLHKVDAIVMHWVANPNTSPQFNREYFENRKRGETGYGSAHYIVGIDGYVMHVVPNDEVAYHCGSETYTKEAEKRFGTIYTTQLSPNFCTIGVELCHKDWTGEFTEETLDSASQLVSKLLKEYDLDEEDITTHHLIVGWKDCPKYWTENPIELLNFRDRVKKLLEES